MIRADLDTSVFVSTLIVPAGVPAHVFAAWRATRFVLFPSRRIIAQTRHTLDCPRIRRRYAFTDSEVNRFLALLELESVQAKWEPDVSEAGIRDPNDDMILSCALAGSASFLVS